MSAHALCRLFGHDWPFPRDLYFDRMEAIHTCMRCDTQATTPIIDDPRYPGIQVPDPPRRP